MQGLNRRQKRMQEKESKKAKKSGKDNIAAADPALVPSAAGNKKKVVAENGKVLVVDFTGNVYLEEENEDGEVAEYLLDVNHLLWGFLYSG